MTDFITNPESANTKNFTYVCEYIWIGGNNEIRSKTKVITQTYIESELEPTSYPIWNYDGSSTGQASSDGNTEVILRPCSVYPDPLRKNKDAINVLILCDTYDSQNNPLPTNTRFDANNIFTRYQSLEPWFGLEQEYFIESNEKYMDNNICTLDDGEHYCGKVKFTPHERILVEEHLNACISCGLTISGINSEVACRQWEFQIGPCTGIQSGDQMTVARYLLERISEKHGCIINYNPKPYTNVNGSGCHVNFSTTGTRELNGMTVITQCMSKLEQNHEKHIMVYGNNNNIRLTGIHETSSYDKFSWGIGTRNTSIRIPNETAKNGYGYFEDRRPASNIDPYIVTSTIFKTCCIEE
jgi:glutamine synthetase